MNQHNRHTQDRRDAPAADHDERSSTLQTLRALMPKRPLPLHEALRLAELQANRLLGQAGIGDDLPVPSELVTSLPRIVVDYDLAMPVSGVSDWDTHRRCWVITLNPWEPATRQRFSLFHEYKHILDHDGPGLVIFSDRTYFGLPPEEYLADYFAGCVLMPKRLLKRAWGDGIQRPTDLAELFDVSLKAMQVRLAQLKLSEAPGRAAVVISKRPFVRPRGGSYHRQLSANWPLLPALSQRPSTVTNAARRRRGVPNGQPEIRPIEVVR